MMVCTHGIDMHRQYCAHCAPGNEGALQAKPPEAAGATVGVAPDMSCDVNPAIRQHADLAAQLAAAREGCEHAGEEIHMLRLTLGEVGAERDAALAARDEAVGKLAEDIALLEKVTHQRQDARDEAAEYQKALDERLAAHNTCALERDQLRAELARVAKERDEAKKDCVAAVEVGERWYERYTKQEEHANLLEIGLKAISQRNTGGFMRRLARITWRWVLVPAMVLNTVAPLLPPIPSPFWEVRGEWTRLTICDGCKAEPPTKEGICGRCGTERFSTIKGQRVYSSFLGLKWVRPKCWVGEAPSGPVAGFAEAK